LRSTRLSHTLREADAAPCLPHTPGEAAMTRDLTVLLLLGFCLAPASRATHAQWMTDMAPNGSFELDANRDGVPDGWTPMTYDSPASTLWDRSVAHSGQVSVRVADSAHPTGTTWRENSGRWVQARRNPVRAGQAYTLKGWLRTDLTAGWATLTLAWSGNGSWLHEDSTEAVTGRTPWTERQLTVEPPAGADEVAVYLILNGGRGAAWFDEVSLLPGRPGPTSREPLDISQGCNAGFADEVAGDGRGGWTDQGDNDARSIPLGMQSWRGVPFQIIDPTGNGGRSCIVLRGRGREDKPLSAEFAVGRKADVVYFLHACGWGGAEGTVAGRYVITYGDGEERIVPLRTGHEIADWWNPHDTPESAAGWRGANPQSTRIGLNIFAWTNPRRSWPRSR
jgi:hypothetical protein